MLKWIGGIAAGVIIGAMLWLLTNRVFPQWFASPPPPPDLRARVECTANPSTVAPNSATEILVKVTLGGEPLEGASVELEVGGGRFNSGTTHTSGNTYSGGVFRTTWTAPMPSAAGYVSPAVVSLDGMRTDKGELSGTYRTNCEILVSR